MGFFRGYAHMSLNFALTPIAGTFLALLDLSPTSGGKVYMAEYVWTNGEK